MPIYEYECLTCGKIEDKLVRSDDADKLQFCDCSLKLSMKRNHKIGLSSFHLKGDWYKTGGEY